MNSVHSAGAGAFVHGSHWMVLLGDWRCRRFWGRVDAWARTTVAAMLVSIVNILTRIAPVVVVVVPVFIVTAVIVRLAQAVVSGRREPRRSPLLARKPHGPRVLPQPNQRSCSWYGLCKIPPPPNRGA